MSALLSSVIQPGTASALLVEDQDFYGDVVCCEQTCDGTQYITIRISTEDTQEAREAREDAELGGVVERSLVQDAFESRDAAYANVVLRHCALGVPLRSSYKELADLFLIEDGTWFTWSDRDALDSAIKQNKKGARVLT